MSQLTRRDFVHSSALTAAAFTLPGLVRPAPRRAQAVATCDLEASAHDAYQKLLVFFERSENFWQLGNAFDTMTDYLLLARNKYPDTQDSFIAFLVGIAFQKYQDTQSGSAPACWYDDYGWWGIASVKAYDPAYASIFAAGTSDSLVGRFRYVALQSWETMHRGKRDGVHKGAPRVFENRDNQSRFDPQPGPPVFGTDFRAPRFEGGVWQYDLFQNARRDYTAAEGGWIWQGPPECNPGTNPSDPALVGVTLGPYQLTVVNGLYFVLALRLRAAGVAEGTGRAANDLHGFLTQWFGLGPSESLLSTFNDGTALVRERVSTYADGHMVENWDSETCWGGDQGLILGGLVDYVALHPGDQVSRTVARQLVSGVKAHMGPNDSYVIDPWFPTTGYECAKFPSRGNKLECWDLGDYKCGSGVFMRYLFHAYQQKHSPIKALVKTKDYQDFLRQAAQKACAVNQGDLFDSLNVLATLTTAIQLLR